MEISREVSLLQFSSVAELLTNFLDSLIIKSKIE